MGKEEERKERVRVKMSDERTLDLVGVATTSKEEPVHWLPCHIEHEGNGNVDKYFYSDVKEDGVLKEAYLRGRRLRGRDFPLPEGYSAMVLEKKSHNCWKAASNQRQLVYWLHGEQPGESDSAVRALEVHRVSEALM